MNGFFNVFKSSGVNSTFIVNKIKRIVGLPCGHMGTLDPMASGVLPVAVGKSSRMFDFLADKIKTYEAEFTFGYETDTLDGTGRIVNENDFIPPEESVRKTIKGFIGQIEQVPPKYSANNVNGKRGYELARKGVDFSLKSKSVFVRDFILTGKSGNTFSFNIVCGKGTYIRSLCRDLAKELGACATMTKLVRTKSGFFTIENSVTLEKIMEDYAKYLIPSDEVVDYPKILLTSEQTKKMLNGVYEIPCEKGFYRVYSPNVFLGIGVEQNGLLKIKAYVNVDKL